MPGCEQWVPIGPDQVMQVASDDLGPRLLILVDECAELLEPSGIRTSEGKEEDALKSEIVQLMKSITALGRSSGMHVVVCTQRNDASIIPGVIQSNCLSVKTKIPRRVRKHLIHIECKEGGVSYDG